MSKKLDLKYRCSLIKMIPTFTLEDCTLSRSHFGTRPREPAIFMTITTEIYLEGVPYGEGGDKGYEGRQNHDWFDNKYGSFYIACD